MNILLICIGMIGTILGGIALGLLIDKLVITPMAKKIKLEAMIRNEDN